MFLKKIDDPNLLYFSLDSFHGPLDLLIHLIQKGEIIISQLSVYFITKQYQNQSLPLDVSAEFIAQAATILWMKSKALLPVSSFEELEVEVDPQWEVVHHLIDYCRFKEVAKELSAREEFQSDVFARGTLSTDVPKKPFGIEHLTLEELAEHFQRLMQKVQKQKGTIKEESLQVADLIHDIRMLLKEQPVLIFNELFHINKSRLELIVTFLALLELMKMGEVIIVKNSNTHEINICYEPRN